MAGSSASLGIQETDVTVLKETLRSQQQLLQQLYAELDVEREASATATNEALSMILRLQGEKASVKMEASQYKRMAEEKICHAEEYLAMYEDLMYQKEMEISALENQIEAYKYKLFSLGCDDLDDFEKQFPETPFSDRNDTIFNAEKIIKSTVRRLSSLPTTLPDPKKISSSSDPVHDPCSSIDSRNFEALGGDQSFDSKRSSVHSPAGDFNYYWEQIRKLDEKVKDISDCKEVGPNKILCANVEQLSQSSPSRANLPPRCLRITTRGDSSERSNQSSGRGSPPSIVLDIFEVPVPEASSEKNKTCFDGEDDNRLKKPESIVGGETCGEDEIDWIKMSNFLNSKPGGEKKLCKTDDCKSPVECDIEWIKKNKLLSTNPEKKLRKLREEKINGECKSGVLRPPTATATATTTATAATDYRSELHQLTQRVEQLESVRNNIRHEISEERKEELSLLKELREQLNSIQSEIRSWRPNKSSPSDDEVTDLLPLTEAMLYFWL